MFHMRKLHLGVDIDGVLADYITQLCDWHNKQYETELFHAEFTEYSLAFMAGVSAEEGNRRIHEFEATGAINNMDVIPGAKPAVTALHAMGHRLSIVTARGDAVRDQTYFWKKLHFGDVFQRMHLSDYKHFTCASFGIDVMIEDNIQNAQLCIEYGTQAVLIEQPWNQKSNDIPRGNWNHAIERVIEYARR
jgi:uncharacterized HAD superfamily protein